MAADEDPPEVWSDRLTQEQRQEIDTLLVHFPVEHFHARLAQVMTQRRSKGERNRDQF